MMSSSSSPFPPIKHFTDASACIVPPQPTVATTDTTPPGSDGKALITNILGCIHTYMVVIL